MAQQVPMPPGYYVAWSGRYENQLHARERLQIVLPIVLVVIFVLLWITYRSVLEAAHVLMAVPFALTGGLFLVWALGYNFSVAVWVGFIALFGTAVQTAVVMVIYLEDALARKRAAVQHAGQLVAIVHEEVLGVEIAVANDRRPLRRGEVGAEPAQGRRGGVQDRDVPVVRAQPQLRRGRPLQTVKRWPADGCRSHARRHPG